MSKIVDLSVFVKDPLIFEGCPDGQTYTIPGEISTKFVIKLSKYQEDIIGLKNNEEEALKKMKEIVVDILNMDKTKNVDLDYIDEHFDNVKILKVIIEQMMNHVREVASDPN